LYGAMFYKMMQAAIRTIASNTANSVAALP
jgi:hypothetical protein